jgi:hypothetical protein
LDSPKFARFDAEAFLDELDRTAFDYCLKEELSKLTSEQLAEVTKLMMRYLDPPLTAAAMLGRIGGRSMSKRKSDSSRQNAAKATAARVRNASERRKLREQEASAND